MKKSSAGGRLSLKAKLTLWFTSFMALTAALCLGLILLVSGSVARREAFSILSVSVRSQLSQVSLEDGVLVLSPDFRFYVNDVYFLIYNQNGALLSGETPPAFPVDAPLENGVSQFVSGPTAAPTSTPWTSGFPPAGTDGLVAAGGCSAVPTAGRWRTASSPCFSIVLPFLVLLAAAGGYLIARRALTPLLPHRRRGGAHQPRGGSLPAHRAFPTLGTRPAPAGRIL